MTPEINCKPLTSSAAYRSGDVGAVDTFVRLLFITRKLIETLKIHKFTTVGNASFFCEPHCQSLGMYSTINVV
jgi:hypothetical protein